MSGDLPSGICVIVAARNSEATIARAVRSALACREVHEVVVVDDSSVDATAAVARAADDGSSRLKIIEFPANRGPSAARNAAIASSISPFLAILDADDFFLENRFSHLDDHDGWDFLADNILFTPTDAGLEAGADPFRTRNPRHRTLGFGEFVMRNISRPGRDRAELGFLKPVMRRAALERLDLRYDEDLRLGEDFILYATALARGARFQLHEAVGYVAIEFAGSLSQRHRTADLAALLEADRALLKELARGSSEHRCLARHVRSIRAKVDYRRFLDRKAEAGLLAAAVDIVAKPTAAFNVAAGRLQDQLLRRQPGSSGTRVLLRQDEFDAG